MLSLQYQALIQEYRRADVLWDAEQERLAHVVHSERARPGLRDVTKSVVCRLPVPALDTVCAT